MKFDIEGYCLDNIDNVKINGSNQIVGTCPWCQKVNKFYLDIETGKYICFSCEQAGNKIARLVAQIEGVSLRDAQKFLMRKQIEPRRKDTPESLINKIRLMRGQEIEEKPEVDHDLPPEYIPIYNGGKYRYPLYLKERGIKKIP